jgi:hypothetical protein
VASMPRPAPTCLCCATWRTRLISPTGVRPAGHRRPGAPPQLTPIRGGLEEPQDCRRGHRSPFSRRHRSGRPGSTAAMSDARRQPARHALVPDQPPAQTVPAQARFPGRAAAPDQLSLGSATFPVWDRVRPASRRSRPRSALLAPMSRLA